MKTYHFSKLQSDIIGKHLLAGDYLVNFLERFQKTELDMRDDCFTINWEDNNTDDDQEAFNLLLAVIDKYIKMKAFF